MRMDGYKRMYVKLFNNLAISFLVFCGALFCLLVGILLIEYRFFNVQAQNLMHLQSQYRKTIAHAQNSLGIREPIIDEKKKMIAAVSL